MEYDELVSLSAMSRILQLRQMENIVLLRCLHFIRVTGHTSAVEINQRKVRNSILFKFKTFFQ